MNYKRTLPIINDKFNILDAAYKTMMIYCDTMKAPSSRSQSVGNSPGISYTQSGTTRAAGISTSELSTNYQYRNKYFSYKK